MVDPDEMTLDQAIAEVKRLRREREHFIERLSLLLPKVIDPIVSLKVEAQLGLPRS